MSVNMIKMKINQIETCVYELDKLLDEYTTGHSEDLKEYNRTTLRKVLDELNSMRRTYWNKKDKMLLNE